MRVTPSVSSWSATTEPRAPDVPRQPGGPTARRRGGPRDIARFRRRALARGTGRLASFAAAQRITSPRVLLALSG